MDSKVEKLKCILNYFDEMRDRKDSDQKILTFERRSLKKSEIPNWKDSSKSISHVIPDFTGKIEREGRSMLQVDFANKYVGKTSALS